MIQDKMVCDMCKKEICLTNAEWFYVYALQPEKHFPKEYENGWSQKEAKDEYHFCRECVNKLNK